MICQIEPLNFLEQSKHCPVIDVRSPGEFRQGHVPGAVNVPVFDDAGRAEIGTLYVQKGREYAIMKGLDLALPRTFDYLDSVAKVSPPNGPIMVHCWRGGLRSAMMAEVFSRARYHVSLLSGGYKAYRRHIREKLGDPAKIMVIGGYTGSGKTELLMALAAKGMQVLDLEALACHKGSVFGAFGQPDQPTNEQFENDLYAQWLSFDLSKVIWMEDESRKIGKVTLPDPVYNHLCNGTLVRVSMPREIRVARLVNEYAGFDRQMLAGAITKITERLGGARANDALKALDSGDFHHVAEIVLAYYDKAYQFSMERRNGQLAGELNINGVDFEKDAERVIAFIQTLTDHENNLPRL